VKISDAMLMKMYGAALLFYPKAFRARYGEEMRDTVCRLHAESGDDLRLIAKLGGDAVVSIVGEHLHAAAAPTPGYGVMLAMFISGVLLAVSVGHQQWLRRAADRVPEHIATLVRNGGPGPLATFEPAEIESQAWLKSDTPFVAIYNAAGDAIWSNATLRGGYPQPPHGVFDVIRERGMYKVTWQPRRDIRVALVGKPMPEGGFVLAGESLLRTETQVGQFDRRLRWVWIAMAVVVLALTARKALARSA
jgi:hypothetical protein